MKLSPCPICGHTPVITQESLDKGHGHGYPGNYDYYIQCSNNGCPLTRKVPFFCMDDIYRTKDQVYEFLHDKWNTDAKRINELIARRAEQKK